jgi:hypothetical protein
MAKIQTPQGESLESAELLKISEPVTMADRRSYGKVMKSAIDTVSMVYCWCSIHVGSLA